MQTGANISTLVDGWLEQDRADKTAIITADDQTWSAADLYAAVCGVATGLTDLGVGKGDRVVLVLDDTPAFPAAFLGAMRCGAVPIPTNFVLRPEDFGYFIDDSEAVAAVLDTPFLEAVGPQVAARPDTSLIVANGTAPDGSESLDEWMAAGGEFSPVATEPEDMAFWLYSSGSTGRPKGVPHRHRDVAGTCQSYAEPVLGIGPEDVVFSSTKMFHAYGLGNNLSFPLWAGATSVYLTGRPTPDRLLERVQSHSPTLYFSVPALYNAALADPGFDDTDWSSVRLGVSAAEALPPEIWRQFYERTGGVEILDGVGSTEMLHIYCSNRAGAVKPGTSGTPSGEYAVEIRDEDGELCEQGDAGEMWVRGPSAPTMYWNQPERTEQKIRGEWFLSGDRYLVDEDGYFVYQGRVDDMMKIGGLWVSPIEIENRLMEHEAVREAAVVATEIDLRSRIKAFVILSEDRKGDDELVAELQDWCKAALQRYEFPHVVAFVDDFPRTATGKVQRFKLRDA